MGLHFMLSMPKRSGYACTNTAVWNALRLHCVGITSDADETERPFQHFVDDDAATAVQHSVTSPRLVKRLPKFTPMEPTGSRVCTGSPSAAPVQNSEHFPGAWSWLLVLVSDRACDQAGESKLPTGLGICQEGLITSALYVTVG